MVATTLGTPVELMSAQVDSETISFPAGAAIFRRGQSANAIFGVRRGIVEVINQSGDKLCVRPGELFSYEDIVWKDGVFRNEAIASTPVELVRLDRLRFLNLLHNHPTLAVQLIAQQHERLREQRASGTVAY
ncbi:Crp/Fnr family transcriptional regulator [Vulcanococcus sp.]|jgi:CRP-like cAMP-binding protein|uniref:Crp/Fnr family transcriptional regulator n=1 Tax=Vulcanococcus sp. TaxID=2856995 RepID=UPI003C0807E9